MGACYRSCCSSMCSCCSSACESCDRCFTDCLRWTDNLFARPYSCCLFFAVVANVAAFITVLVQLLNLGSATYTATCEKPLLAAVAVCLAAFLLDCVCAISVFVRIFSYDPQPDPESPSNAAEYAAIAQLPRDDARAVWFRSSVRFAPMCCSELGNRNKTHSRALFRNTHSRFGCMTSACVLPLPFFSSQSLGQ